MEEGRKQDDNEKCKTSIILLKVAFSGSDIAIDFRSPRSGKSDFRYRNKSHPVEAGQYGRLYNEMIETIRLTLTEESLVSVIPDRGSYDYHLAGLLWLQGWNDAVSDRMTAEYESNLANLLMDIRDDIHSSRLPIFIGELGQIAPGRIGQNIQRIREAQQRVADSLAHVAFVPTHQYSVTPRDDEDRFDGNYHYFGRADIYCEIGRAFGRAVLNMTEDGDGKADEVERSFLDSIMEDGIRR